MEALRIYPPFWMVDRMALADDRAGDSRYSPGLDVVVFIYGAHHSPQYWENPESFDQQRFSKAKEKSHTPFAHLALRGRSARMHRRQLRDAADADDSECPASKVRFQSGSGPND